MLLKIDTFTTYRDLHELSGWALELAGDPAVDGHPRRAEVEAPRPAAAWRRASWTWPCGWRRPPSTTPASPPQRHGPSRRGPRSHCSGAILGAREDFLAAAEAHGGHAQQAGPRARGLGAAYGGDVPRARALLDRVFASSGGARAPSPRRSATTPRPRSRPPPIPSSPPSCTGRAIEPARPAGAPFIEGVASVGLVRLWTAGGRTRQALEGYRTLLTGWRRSGHWTQTWTTLRNLAVLLAGRGQLRGGGPARRRRRRRFPRRPASRSTRWPPSWPRWTSGLVAELGPERLAAVPEAGRLARTEVVDAALLAIDRALG